jgi:hypothetical protein
VGFHSLTTTTHPPTSKFHLQGSKLPLGRLPVRSLSPGGTGPRPPWSGTLHKNLCQVWGVASSAISVNSHQRINLHHPAGSFLAGHLNATSLQHLAGLLGVRLIKRARGADPIRSRRRLYRACRRWEKQRAAPNVQPAGLSCAPAAVLLCVRSVRYLTATGVFR